MNEEIDTQFFFELLDSFKNPVLFADIEHRVRYLNRAARQFYPDGERLLGRSLLDCHNPQSQRQLREILQQFEEGLDEVLISDNDKRRIYMRAVRSAAGELRGYYERFEPPRGE